MDMTPSKPTVAHLAKCYFRLSENWLHTQVRNLRRYRPVVLTWETANLDACGDELPPVHVLNRSLVERVARRVLRRVTGGSGWQPGLRRALKRHEPQLIHAHFGPMGVTARRLARAAGVPLVTTFYGYDLSRLPESVPVWRDWYQKLFDQGACFLVEGGHMKRQLIGLGCPEDKVRVQHLGVDLSDFPDRRRRLEPEEPLRILAAGRFTEKKGLVYAVRAFALFLAGGGRGRLTIIGDARPGNEAQQTVKRDLISVIDQEGVGAHVDLRGMRPHAELKRAYYDHHAFLSPSVRASDGDNEGGAPVAVIEASASGLPVVATRHCDIPEVVRHDETGYLSEERDVAALAGFLERLFRDRERVTEMGRRARRHVEKEYDASVQGRKLEEIYAAVMSAQNPCGTTHGGAL